MSSNSAAGSRIVALIGGLFSASLLIAGELKSPPLPPSGEAQTPSDAARPVQARPPGCERWSDGCVTCTASGDGTPICSNTGIACTPKQIRCTAADHPPNTPEKPNPAISDH